MLNRPELVLLDLDPALFHEDPDALRHLAAAVDVIRSRGVAIRMLTNDSLRSPHEAVAALNGAGLLLSRDELITAAQYLGAWISARTPRATVYLLGSEPARDQLEQAGLRVVDDPDEIGYLCDYVVAGAFPGWSYDALVHAYRCYTVDAVFVTIETESAYRTASGLMPAGGVTTAALGALFGKGPRFCAGMPSAGFLKYVLERAGTEPRAALLLSDARRDASAAAAAAEVPVLRVGVAGGDAPSPVMSVASYSDLADALRTVLP